MSNFNSFQIPSAGFDRADHERTKAEFDASLKAERDADLSAAQERTGNTGGVHSVVMRDGQMDATYSKTNRATAGDLRTGAGGLLDTATTAWGTPQAPSDVKGDSLVTIDGMSMTAAIAERMGLLTRDAGGFYREVGSATGPF
ncbi:hypothetical protein [Azospirillum sp. sgz301742]